MALGLFQTRFFEEKDVSLICVKIALRATESQEFARQVERPTLSILAVTNRERLHLLGIGLRFLAVWERITSLRTLDSEITPPLLHAVLREVGLGSDLALFSLHYLLSKFLPEDEEVAEYSLEAIDEQSTLKYLHQVLSGLRALLGFT